MKLLHVMAGAPTGGAENIFLEQVLALCDGGFEQAVVTRPNNDFRTLSFKARGISLRHAFFDRFPFSGATAKAIAETMESFRPDLIQYWMGRAGTFAKKGRVPQIGWYGGYYKLARFKHCDFHIALTEDIQRHIVAQGVPPVRTRIIRTFAEFPLVTPADRAKLDTPTDAPLLLSLARLHWKKGLDVLLKALAERPGVYLWIAGEGPLRAELEALTENLGLKDRVRFLGWRDDRAALLAAADICVFPSRYEPFGTVTVDAWAAGVPLIAAAAQGPKAYVTDGTDGLLVPIDDIGALATAIRRVQEEPGLRAKLIEGGTQTYRARFTKDVFLRESRAFYDTVLGTQGAIP
jgi:glycosyltransferase involved in cell wall biosynthesis